MRHRVIVNTAFSKIWTLLLGTSDEIDQKEVIGGGGGMTRGLSKTRGDKIRSLTLLLPWGSPLTSKIVGH